MIFLRNFAPAALFTVLAGFASPAVSAPQPVQVAKAEVNSGAVPLKGDIRVSDVWARAARQGDNAYVFLTVKNAGPVPVRLKGAFSDVATEVRLVTFGMQGPYLRTSRSEPVAVPAHDQFVLEPGVIALELWRVKRDLRAGERLPIAVDFLVVGRVKAVADVDSRGAVRYSDQRPGAAAKARH